MDYIHSQQAEDHDRPPSKNAPVCSQEKGSLQQDLQGQNQQLLQHETLNQLMPITDYFLVEAEKEVLDNLIQLSGEGQDQDDSQEYCSRMFNGNDGDADV